MSDRTKIILRWGALIVVGVLAIIGLTSLFSEHEDRSAETVAADAWVSDMCGIYGTWRGNVETIEHDTRRAHLEHEEVGVDLALQRLIASVREFDEAILRLGVPDVPRGSAAQAVALRWARDTERSLQEVQRLLDEETTDADSYRAEGAAIATIQRSRAAALRAAEQIESLDPALASAFEEQGTCRELRED